MAERGFIGRGATMDRDELLAFATWLLKDESGEGREEEIVDKYLAERNVLSEHQKRRSDDNH